VPILLLVILLLEPLLLVLLLLKGGGADTVLGRRGSLLSRSIPSYHFSSLIASYSY